MPKEWMTAEIVRLEIDLGLNKRRDTVVYLKIKGDKVPSIEEGIIINMYFSLSTKKRWPQ